MARNRYVRYYRLVETVDERGRFHTRTEYIGEDYAFVASAQEARRTARNGLLAAMAGWVFYVAALLLPSVGSRTVYVSLPFILTAVPLGLSFGILWEALRKKLPLDARMADRLDTRYPARTLPVVILPLMSVTGEAVLLLRGSELMQGDGVFAFCAAALAACGMFLFRKRAMLRCRVLPKEEEGTGPAWNNTSQPDVAGTGMAHKEPENSPPGAD